MSPACMHAWTRWARRQWCRHVPQTRFDPGQLQLMSEEDTLRTAHARAAFDHAARQHGLSVCDAPGEAPVSLGWMETRSVVDETVKTYHDLVVMVREPELPANVSGPF